MATKYLIDEPKGVDKPIQALQVLFDELAWIDTSYGRTFRNVRQDETGKNFFAPYVYTGNDQYLECIPDKLTDGNSVFFIAKDQKLINKSAFETEVSAVFFIDLRTAFPSLEHRAIENAKMDVADKLAAAVSKDFTLIENEIEILENFEDCYREYSYKEMNQLATMHPYAIFRINFTINYRNDC